MSFTRSSRKLRSFGAGQKQPDDTGTRPRISNAQRRTKWWHALQVRS